MKLFGKQKPQAVTAATPGDIGLTSDGRVMHAEPEKPKARRRMYASARPSRTSSPWSTSSTSADSEIHTSLTGLRSRSRTLDRDAPYAKKAKSIVVNNVIGNGIGLQAQVKGSRGELLKRANDGIEGAFRYWCEAAYCHTGGELHFHDMERQGVDQVFATGEVFFREHFTSFGGCRIPYALELIESERVPHEDLRQIVQPADGNEIRSGIEVDRFYRPVAYYIRDRHPSDYMYPISRSSEEVRRIPANEITHLRVIERWPQVRGVPWLHAAATKLHNMDGYTDAELVAARGAANYLGWLESSDLDDTDVEEQEDGTYQTELEPGIIGRGPPGSEMKFNNPNRPNAALDPFMRYMLREAAAGIGPGIRYAALSGDYSQATYSSERASTIDDRDGWRALQMWFIRAFRQRVHRRFLQQAVFAECVEGVSPNEYGYNREKFEAVKFKPRGWSWIDPTNEVEAYKEAIRANLTTQSRVISMTGGGDDIEEVLEERANELALAKALKLTSDVDPPVPEQTEEPPAEEPAADEADDESSDRRMRVVK